MIRRLFNGNKAQRLREALNPLSNVRPKSAYLNTLENFQSESKFTQYWVDFAKKPKGFGRFNRRKGASQENENKESN